MWILNESKELLQTMQLQLLCSVCSINSSISQHYIPPFLVTNWNQHYEISLTIINQSFFHKNGNCRFQYVVLGYADTYFLQGHSDIPQKYYDADVVKMLEYLIDIFVELGGGIFQQTFDIPVGHNCGPFLADLFLYLYRAEFIQGFMKIGKKKSALPSNSISPTGA